MVKIFDDIEARGSLELAMSVMGFESSEKIVAAILGFAFAAVGIVLLIIYIKIAKEKSVATVRQVRNDKTPELTLELGLAYHAFLSHVWSSGQDQCAMTKQYHSGNPTRRRPFTCSPYAPLAGAPSSSGS